MFTLVGNRFRPAEAKTIVRSAEIGDRFKLEHDPDNEYDSNAVKVMSEDGEHHLGFIAREENEEVAQELSDGAEIFVTVASRIGTDKLLLEREDDE